MTQIWDLRINVMGILKGIWYVFIAQDVKVLLLGGVLNLYQHLSYKTNTHPTGG